MTSPIKIGVSLRQRDGNETPILRVTIVVIQTTVQFDFYLADVANMDHIIFPHILKEKVGIWVNFSLSVGSLSVCMGHHRVQSWAHIFYPTL